MSIIDRFKLRMSNYFKRIRKHKRGVNTGMLRKLRKLFRRVWKRIRSRARNHLQHQGHMHNKHHHLDYGSADSNRQGALFLDELFGFRVRVRIVENQVYFWHIFASVNCKHLLTELFQPCALGVTCDAGGHKLSPNSSFNFNFLRRYDNVGETEFLKRQVDEQFESDAPPECRITLNPYGCVFE